MEAVENKLYQYSEYKKRIEEQEKQIAELMDKKDALAERMLRGQNLDAVRVMGGLTSDPVFAAVQKIIDVYGTRLDAIRNEITDMFYHIDEIEKMVSDAGLTETERQYIQLRYFEGLQPKRICFEMNYSDSWLRDIKKAALRKIQAV